MRFVDRKKAIAHLLWMTQNMPDKEKEPEKWNRCLGFIQGCMYITFKFTIDKLRILNKRGLESALFNLSIVLTIIGDKFNIEAKKGT